MKQIVTLIVPVTASHLDYLPRALASIKRQTAYSATQTIIVNDTGQPLEVNNFPATILATRGKRGASKARNLGLSKVTTPFTMFLDADDLLVDATVENTLRAFALYKAAYIYGDGFTLEADGREGYYFAPMYDRNKLYQRNLHNVTALVPTKILNEAGGFDEVVKGYEDWELFLRLAVNGQCGAKIPAPLIVYRLHSGVNRNESSKISGEIYADVQGLYRDYFEKGKPLMGCCGVDPDALRAAQEFDQQNPPMPNGGAVVLEYTDTNKGTIPFRSPITKSVYRGAADDENRFAQADPRDVGWLVGLGCWRRVPVVAATARRPLDDAGDISVSVPNPIAPVAVDHSADVSIPAAKARRGKGAGIAAAA